MNKKRKLFFINSSLLALSSVIFRILAIFFNSYITKQIGKEMLGVFNLVMSVYIFGITLGSFGISFAMIRLISEELAIFNKDSLYKIAKKSIFLSFIFGISTSFLFAIFSNFITHFCLHDKIHKNVIYLLCLAIPFIAMSSTINGYFIAVRHTYKSTIIQFLEQILKIIITIFILRIFLPKVLEYACFALILGDLLSEFFCFGCNYFFFTRDLKRFHTNYHTKYEMFYFTKKILKLASPIAITSLIRSGLSTLKQIIIPLSFSKRNLNFSNSLSIYGEINGMVLPIILFPNIIFSSVSSLFIPEFATYNAQNRRRAIKKFTTIILVISTFLCALIAIFFGIFSEKLGILIYNDSSVSHYIKILSPLVIFTLFDCVIDNILKGLNAQNSVMIINIFDTLIDVLLIYFIVPKLGVSGYIVSIYVSEIVNVILSSTKLWKIVYKNPLTK